MLFENQLETLNGLLKSNPGSKDSLIVIYLRLLRLELGLKSKLHLQDPNTFKINLKNYNKHALLNQFKGLNNIDSTEVAEFDKAVGDFSSILKQMTFNDGQSLSANPTPTFPNLRFADHSDSICAQLAEYCDQIEKIFRGVK
jgi:hypothetical protein